MGHYLRGGFTDPRRGIGDVFYSEMSFTGMKHLVARRCAGLRSFSLLFKFVFYPADKIKILQELGFIFIFFNSGDHRCHIRPE
jgi:hypothetical protein